MFFLATVLFLVFHLAGLYFLFNEGRMLKNPLVKKQKYFATGPQLFLMIVLATGMFMLEPYSTTRFSVWMVCMAFGVLTIEGRVKFTPALMSYMVYLFFLFFSLFYNAPDKEFGIRVIAKYSYPIFILMFANKVGNSEFAVFSTVKFIFIAAIFVEISYLLWLPWIGLLWTGATLADHVVVMTTMAVALLFITKKKKYLLLAAFFVIYPVVATVRTGLIGLTASLSIFFIFKYKLKALPVVFVVAAAATMVVLYVPGVREKMFRKEMTAQEIIDNRDNLTMKDIDMNGRQAMWDWSLAKFYENNKVFGTGVGNLQYVFYSGDHPFGKIRIVHNDYVQILADTGLIGLILYLSIGLCMLIHSFFIYNDKRSNAAIKFCAIVAGATIIGIMATSYTDNSVNYTMATYAYPYAFYGMALGLRQKYGM